jgi:hypothetical protein
VRWPGETGGAFGFALIFLVLFASRQKEQKNCIKTKKVKQVLLHFNFIHFLLLVQKKVPKKVHRQRYTAVAGAMIRLQYYC